MAELPVFGISKNTPEVAAGKLLVLVPAVALDAYKAGRLVWALALEQRREVLFLSVVPAPGDEIRVSRLLSNLLSVTKDPRLQVNARIEFSVSWPAAIRKLSRPGDQIICLEDQSVRHRIGRSSSLADSVSRALKMTVSFLY